MTTASSPCRFRIFRNKRETSWGLALGRSSRSSIGAGVGAAVGTGVWPHAGSGWPTSEAVEKEVLAWFDAKNLDEEKAAVKRLNKAALEDVIYAPTGFFLSYTAWRKNVSGIAKGPLPFFWGVSKTA